MFPVLWTFPGKLPSSRSREWQRIVEHFGPENTSGRFCARHGDQTQFKKYFGVEGSGFGMQLRSSLKKLKPAPAPAPPPPRSSPPPSPLRDPAPSPAPFPPLETSSPHDNIPTLGEPEIEIQVETESPQSVPATDPPPTFSSTYPENFWDGPLEELTTAIEQDEYPVRYEEQKCRARPGSTLMWWTNLPKKSPKTWGQYKQQYKPRRTTGKRTFEKIRSGSDPFYPIMNMEKAPAAPAALSFEEELNEDDFQKEAKGYGGIRLVPNDQHVLASTSDQSSKILNSWVAVGSALPSFNSMFLDHAHTSEAEWISRLGIPSDDLLELSGDYMIKSPGVRYDPNRRMLNATQNDDLNKVAEFLHKLIAPRMPAQFHDYEHRFKTYCASHAAALATMEGALRQPAHVDTHREGYSVLVAVESDVKVVVLEGSRALVQRIDELWKLWVKGGRHHPEGVKCEDWWDFVAWRQLSKEGWGKGGKVLKAVTVVIPKGCALVFSTWVMHCGAEWSYGDFVGCNRVHFYMTPFFVNKDASSVNMHSREPELPGKSGGGDYQISFSPALHFLPAPNVNCSVNEEALPTVWLSKKQEEKIKRLRETTVRRQRA